MKNKFTLVINSGRSGSTYLYGILKKNFSPEAYIAHEDIPASISLPRKYNRAYDLNSIHEVLKDRELKQYIDRWQEKLSLHPVIETGWTAYHMAPILHHVFQERFQYIILHRHPVEFAASRAAMGNYQAFYNTTSHEVSPFDPHNIYPKKQEQWNRMNHFEKCLFWWYVVYLEAFEFRSKYPQVPHLEISSKSLFNQQKLDSLISFLGFNISPEFSTEVRRNPLPRFLHETFPLKDEWRDYKKHPDIIAFAENLGYSFKEEELKNKTSKYKLPQGFLALIRNKTRYWLIKRHIGEAYRKILSHSKCL